LTNLRQHLVGPASPACALGGLAAPAAKDIGMPRNPLIRTLMVAGWFVLGAVFVGWQLSDGKLTKAVRDAAHIEAAEDGGEESDGISFGGETHQLSLGDGGGDDEDAEAAEDGIDEGDDQATEDDDDSESAEQADAGESSESDFQSDESEEPQHEAAPETGSTDEDDEDEDDHVGIGDD
jgi:hypothetical protein